MIVRPEVARMEEHVTITAMESLVRAGMDSLEKDAKQVSHVIMLCKRHIY